MVLKKKVAAVLMTCAMVLVMAACSKTNSYSLGTGGMGGNYYAYGNVLAELVQTDALSVEVKTTAGSAANLRLLQKGFLDMAIVQSDVLLDAYQGTGLFEGNASEGVRAVAGLYMEECQVVVRADSDIYAIEDLYGKAVSVGEEESGVLKNAEQILMVNGLDFNLIDASYLSFSDAAAALKNGEIDAFFCTADAPTTAVAELARGMDIRLISLDERTCEQLIREYPCYSVCEIPAGTYSGQTEAVTTLGVKAVLVVSDKVPDAFVKSLTDTLFANAEKLQYATSADQISIEFAIDAITAPFHEGAAAWYSENGVTVDTNGVGTTDFGVDAGQD